MQDQREKAINDIVAKTVEAAKKIDETIRKHVIMKMPAEPGWKYGLSNLQGTELTVHEVTTWAFLGPMEFPIPMVNWVISVLPIDEETGKPVSIGGFQGIFGPEYNDEQIKNEIKRNMQERMRETEASMQKMFEGMEKLSCRVAEAAKYFPKA